MTAAGTAHKERIDRMKIIDSHVHITSSASGHEPLYAQAERLCYDKLTIMSLQCLSPAQNAAAALCKLQNPDKTYVFGGLDYVSGRDFRTQAETLRGLGYDGVKMLEGKPTTRRQLKLALDDSVYDGFFSYLEETGFPVLLHVADPDTFWDENRAPAFAAENGWLYGEDDEPYERYYVEVDNMLRKHPRLKAVFAHFYFLSWDAARAQYFLDAHPDVSIDVTAGIEMYENFSLDPESWRRFFIKNKERIIFGTDSTDGVPDETELSTNGYAQMEIDFLTYAKPIEIYGMKLHGLGLPEDVCAKILADNFIRLVGAGPHRMDAAAVKKDAELLLGYIKDADDRLAMEGIIAKL